jgi:hypothetical protein
MFRILSIKNLVPSSVVASKSWRITRALRQQEIKGEDSESNRAPFASWHFGLRGIVSFCLLVRQLTTGSIAADFVDLIDHAGCVESVSRFRKK